jgi:hypothetical protein
MLFYGLKIYDDNKLVRDFNPCVDQDGAIWLQDIVSSNLFKLDGVEIYKEPEKTKCNCWRCIAERLFNARSVSKMKVGKVYLYQMYSESFEEFDTLEDAKSFRDYADENISYWDYDPVSTIDLSDGDNEKIIIYKHRGWIEVTT